MNEPTTKPAPGMIDIDPALPWYLPADPAVKVTPKPKPKPTRQQLELIPTTL
jgi:hypothetical protein